MSNDVDVDIFEKEASCTYRGETYYVRDNGAVFRCMLEGRRRRPLDETWTLGTASKADGYMTISAHKVHRIIATAFHGEQPSKGHVVDHIDTNRRNNRPSNLRWVTRLENLILNPITAKRIELLYGSIEEFLANPSDPKNGPLTMDFEWMRSVTLDEAEYSRKRLLAWAKTDQPSGGGTIGDWVFGRAASPQAPAQAEPLPQLVSSKTEGAVQRNWKIPAAFPLCPQTSDETPLAAYFDRLNVGATVVESPFGTTKVSEAVMSENNAILYILGDQGEDAIKQWSLAKITFEKNQFVHESLGTFFTREGAAKQLALAQGLTWEGGETIDDYC